MTYIFELITLITTIGAICYLTEKFVMKKDNECNSSQRK